MFVHEHRSIYTYQQCSGYRRILEYELFILDTAITEEVYCTTFYIQSQKSFQQSILMFAIVLATFDDIIMTKGELRDKNLIDDSSKFKIIGREDFIQY